MKGKKFGDMTKEEAQETGRLGGINSGKARRKARTMKDALSTILALPLKNTDIPEIEEIQSLADMQGVNIDVNTAVIMAQVKKALKGSVMSAEFLRDTAGQRPEDILNLQTENDTALNINISYSDDKKADSEEPTEEGKNEGDN